MWRGCKSWLQCVTDTCNQNGTVQCDRCHASACVTCSHMWMTYSAEAEDWEIICLRCVPPEVWQRYRPYFFDDEYVRDEEEERQAQEARARLCLGC